MARSISFAQACEQYPHRFTMTHVPTWARRVRNDGTFYAPQYRDCREWYENTKFPGEHGISTRSRYCESSGETWPLGLVLPVVFNSSHGLL